MPAGRKTGLPFRSQTGGEGASPGGLQQCAPEAVQEGCQDCTEQTVRRGAGEEVQVGAQGVQPPGAEADLQKCRQERMPEGSSSNFPKSVP